MFAAWAKSGRGNKAGLSLEEMGLCIATFCCLQRLYGSSKARSTQQTTSEGEKSQRCEEHSVYFCAHVGEFFHRI